VSVRVVSWIGFHLLAKQAIHEETLITTNGIRKMKNDKWKIEMP